MNKDYWIGKDSGHLTDGNPSYTDPSRIPPKRSQQWFVNPSESELFPNKKQAVAAQASNARQNPEMFNAHATQWHNNSSESGLFPIKKQGVGAQASNSRPSPEMFNAHATQWHNTSSESGLFPNKKQLVSSAQASNTRPSPEMFNAEAPQWDNTPNYQPVPRQFINSLFGGDTGNPVDFIERNISFEIDNQKSERRAIDEQLENDPPVGLSIYHASEDSGPGMSYGGNRKVKVNQIKELDNAMQAPTNEQSYNNSISLGQSYDRGNETSFVSIGQCYSDAGNVTLMGHMYDRGDSRVRAMTSAYDKGDANAMSIGQAYNGVNNNTMPFDGYQDGAELAPTTQILSYDLFYNNQSGVESSETATEKEIEAPLDKAIVEAPNVISSVPAPKPAKLKPVPKAKSESKAAKNEAPNSFPSNVRSLISTGMLDGVPVKYVSLSREEHRGIIKGAGYLCGCQNCNYSKALSAYEFERHAGSKTKHPNNHIYFENGKTIYNIVQELRSTPESLLFDAVLTVTGSEINQKAFKIWKESFQAATRELQRIYGKEELNL